MAFTNQNPSNLEKLQSYISEELFGKSRGFSRKNFDLVEDESISDKSVGDRDLIKSQSVQDSSNNKISLKEEEKIKVNNRISNNLANYSPHFSQDNE